MGMERSRIMKLSIVSWKNYLRGVQSAWLVKGQPQVLSGAQVPKVQRDPIQKWKNNLVSQITT